MTAPRIEESKDRHLIGIRIQTSNGEHRTFELWRQFKPRVKEIQGRKSTGFFSVQIFPPELNLPEFTDETRYEKWAAVEVENFDTIPEGMEPFLLESGMYAVFIHRGPASTGHQTFQYIFGQWLPNSAYTLDKRPHFEFMTDQYKPDDPLAEEEFWIPIKNKL